MEDGVPNSEQNSCRQCIQLRAECSLLREEIKELREQIRQLNERLNTNSRNSSTPPSQDPFRKKRNDPPSGKKPGGQPGHQGHARQLYSPDQVSKILEVKPDVCPSCSTQLNQTVSVEVRQVVDLPAIPPEVTQYNIHTCKCGKCGEKVRASIPKEAEKAFGPRLMAFVTMLHAEGHATKRKICSIAEHLGIKISLGALCNIHKLASLILEKPSDEIHSHVLAQSNLNADESSWRLRNKLCWLWTGATPNATVFRIDPSRSQAAFNRIFRKFNGNLTTDRHGAYNHYEGDKQTCLSHILRDFEKISERSGLDGSCGRILKEKLKGVFGFWKQFKHGEISRLTLQQVTSPLVDDIYALLVFAANKATNSKTIACAHNLLERFPTLWTFLHQEGVEPTNNLAERAIRPAVILRKLSGGSQSEWGVRMVERLMTVAFTIKQNAGNLFTFLTNSFKAHMNGQAPPSPFAA